MESKSLCNICGRETILLLKVVSPPQQNRFFTGRNLSQEFPCVMVRYFYCKKCHHLSINKELKINFDVNYNNSQAASPFMIAQYNSILNDIEAQIKIKTSEILEIGCGQGELLQLLNECGYKNIRGYDPAGPSKNKLILNKLWCGGDEIKFDLIIVRHTLEEIDDPNCFIGLVANSLNSNGMLYCEITNVNYLLDSDDAFSLYPEYKNIFSVSSLSNILSDNGIVIEKITKINSGEWLGIWGRRVANIPPSLNETLCLIKKQIELMPRPIVLWGAGGRAGNILSFLRLGLDDVEFVVDINKSKQGLYMPPFGQLIISPDQLHSINPKTIMAANDKYLNEISQIYPVKCELISLSQFIKFDERS